VVSASLRLLYSLFYSEHINHIQVLGFLSFPYSFHTHSPLSVWCDPCQIIGLHLSIIQTLRELEFLDQW
jgi:hypothetical protein